MYLRKPGPRHIGKLGLLSCTRQLHINIRSQNDASRKVVGPPRCRVSIARYRLPSLSSVWLLFHDPSVEHCINPDAYRRSRPGCRCLADLRRLQGTKCHTLGPSRVRWYYISCSWSCALPSCAPDCSCGSTMRIWESVMHTL